MNIFTYRKTKGLSQLQLASELTAAGVQSTQGLISQWERGDVVIPAERAIEVERATGGQVTRHDLRPDVFGEEKDAA